MTTIGTPYDNDNRCHACIEHPGWAHGDVLRRSEPADVCRACYGSGFDQSEPDVCEHGTPAVDGGSSTGFTGAPVYWTTYADGCQVVDDSADTLDYVR